MTDFFKLVLRPLYGPVVSRFQPIRSLVYRPRSREDIHTYWRQPDLGNLPQDYVQGEARSRFLVDIVRRHVPPAARILEIGCNVGRNLHHLFLADFRDLSGVEISESALQLMKQVYPALAARVRLYHGPIEGVIRGFNDDEFDLVFTMAVLEHLHPASEWVFSQMVRITKDLLVTIEDEHTTYWRNFARDYRGIFEHRGMEQVVEMNCGDVDDLGPDIIARVFRRVEHG